LSLVFLFFEIIVGYFLNAIVNSSEFE